MTRYAAAILSLSLAAGAAPAKVTTETVTYEAGGTKLKGFLAYDASLSRLSPGVIIFPEWWGVNDYAKQRAVQFAEMGYAALVADLYGDGKVIDTAHPQDAAKMAGALRANVEVWRGRAEAARAKLLARPSVDAKNVVAIGYCLGGSTALQLAYTGADLKAVATFHAALPTPTAAEAKAIKAKVLVCHGEADSFIPAKAITDFKAALGEAKVSLDFKSYPGVVHSFTVPAADKVGNPGMKYDRAADEDSWSRMMDLFRRELGRR